MTDHDGTAGAAAQGGAAAQAAVRAVRTGDLATLARMLAETPGLATARLTEHGGRTLLHIVTDWPGHVPGAAAIVRALVAAGADVDAPSVERHRETPLHWAASCDDLEALDALLDAGADLDAPGSVIDGGTPLADAVAFGQWRAARRLVERGARTTLWQAAALGLQARVEEQFEAEPPSVEEVSTSFWCACHGGQPETAAYLLERGADLNRIGFDDLTPVQAARRAGADELVRWLLARGAV